ncbi:FmdB family zinc ribbon protein [Desulfonatronovibrio hydrogenovorans]|uniref:FmdB family zinc ribbon protein n=1 Tax=Desulfonatronovibrio hydrogenovorans TaxID=53245 RepID=UPI00048E6A6C|nr:zinc ribbon domain-containing protein [Desulfonatronovibrio hydrogenovorans]
MPIYEYRCSDCQQVFEEWQKGFEDRDMVCPVCGGASSRLISNSAFVLKGSGWYVTDYCNRQSSAGNGNGQPKAQEASSGPDTASGSGSGGSGATTDSSAD